ncbi:MAG: undecaprenyl/decaprenyl-phosphate alpha-N-acetylglucosaminyl 1-phosphate transferase [Fimbriimonadaceae bacterium]|nr:undecaprenyl/decaprenyl-phosphate alpha-N-acetylglucosaminyl 1-phosphate transferase [Fimbriimonadaceae bacterium]
MLDSVIAAAQATPKFWGGFRYPLFTGLVAMLITWGLTPRVRMLAFKSGAVDDPKRDDRRIHKEPLPRWGGIAIFIGIAIAIAAVLPFAFPKTNPYPLYLVGMLVVGALLVVAGALDDLYQYSAKIQLLILLGAGVAIQFFAGSIGKIQIRTLGIPFTDHHIQLLWAAIPLTAIYIFIVTKTMDTIDGVDGLASGIAAISAGTLMTIAVYEGQPRVAIIAAAVGGSCIGFLRHNYNPAKIIMGTGGAYILGFTLACLSIVGAVKTAAALTLIIPIFVFGVPIFDAIQVVIRRKLSGVPITQADKRHLHHQLLKRGLSQRQTVWVLYLAAAALCGTLLVIILRSYA